MKFIFHSMDYLYQFFKASPFWATLFLSALPVSELRGAIPLAILQYKFSWYKAFGISVIGNMMPIIPWLLFLNYFQGKLMRFRLTGQFFTWLFERTRKKGGLIEKYETVGLMLFVAVPLPMTGAWSGAIAAFVFGIRFRHAIIAITLGVLIAGIIVTVLVKLGWIGAVVAGIALTILAVGAVIEIFKCEK